MGGRGPQTFKKRQKEQLRKEKQQEKNAKRAERRTLGGVSPLEEEIPLLDGPVIYEVDEADLPVLQAAVLESESLVNLSEAKARCELVEADSERPGELFNQLCHMEVLLAAASALLFRGIPALYGRTFPVRPALCTWRGCSTSRYCACSRHLRVSA